MVDVDRDIWRARLDSRLRDAAGAPGAEVLRERLAFVAPLLATFANRFGGDAEWLRVIAVDRMVRELDMDGAGVEGRVRRELAALV